MVPADTRKNRPSGMRADMVQLLADMKPGLSVFPADVLLRGFDLTRRYQWKKTIGPIEERQLIINGGIQICQPAGARLFFKRLGLVFSNTSS